MAIGYLHLDSWAGRTKHKIIIVKETARRYKIKWLDTNTFRFKTSQEYYVPKHAVTLT